ARFVSGYEDVGVQDQPGDLHAWAEAYVPGGGWRGYDPSRGLATGRCHVAVAAAATPGGAAPVTGSFRAAHGTSRLHSEVLVQRRVAELVA
ncbi:MAG TPA: transglutaminase-like domain-containing protein, partial [Lacipirellulaceae bacterium]|nr:transglutaminase-like domain-containing protein [Lacipirellulaceae bacterium]